MPFPWFCSSIFWLVIFPFLQLASGELFFSTGWVALSQRVRSWLAQGLFQFSLQPTTLKNKDRTHFLLVGKGNQGGLGWYWSCHSWVYLLPSKLALAWKSFQPSAVVGQELDQLWILPQLDNGGISDSHIICAHWTRFQDLEGISKPLISRSLLSLHSALVLCLSNILVSKSYSLLLIWSEYIPRINKLNQALGPLHSGDTCFQEWSSSRWPFCFKSSCQCDLWREKMQECMC